MPTPKVTDDVLRATVATYEGNARNQNAAADLLGISRSTLQIALKKRSAAAFPSRLLCRRFRK